LSLKAAVGTPALSNNPRQPSARLRRPARSIISRPQNRNCGGRERAAYPDMLPKCRRRLPRTWRAYVERMRQGGGCKDAYRTSAVQTSCLRGSSICAAGARIQSMSNASPRHLSVLHSLLFAESRHRYDSERSAVYRGLRNVRTMAGPCGAGTRCSK